MRATENEYVSYARHILGLAEEATGRMTIKAITKGGSDRCFYRLSFRSGQSFLFMAYGRQQEENAYWTGIGAFLAELGIPVPAVYGHDPERGFVLMEDLGDRDLWSCRHEPWEVRRDLYRKVLKSISPLHSFVENYPVKEGRRAPANLRPLTPPCYHHGLDPESRDMMKMLDSGLRRNDDREPEMKFFRDPNLPTPFTKTMKGYDRDLYRWEQDYFLEQFVRDFCRISLAEREEAALREELEALSGRLLAAGTALVHRDLQSQNIMICRGEPVFIDFQGLRRGSRFYDLGSLLCDPYVTFTEAEREELLRYVYELPAKNSGRAGLDGEVASLRTDWPSFTASFLDGSAQRLMQALGAFGFLGLKKGKEAFLGHIPRGIENLYGTAAASRLLPRLMNLVERCREKVNKD